MVTGGRGHRRIRRRTAVASAPFECGRDRYLPATAIQAGCAGIATIIPTTPGGDHQAWHHAAMRGLRAAGEQGSDEAAIEGLR